MSALPPNLAERALSSKATLSAGPGEGAPDRAHIPADPTLAPPEAAGDSSLDPAEPAAAEDGETHQVKVGTLELLFDLVIVVVIHNIAETIEEGPIDFRKVLTFGLRVMCSWFLWHSTVMWLNAWQTSRRREYGLFEQTMVGLIMCAFAFMAAATASDNDQLFLSVFMVAYALITCLSFCGPLKNNDSRWAFLLGLVAMAGFLTPAAILDKHRDLALILWSSWALVLVLMRLVGGYLYTERTKGTHFVDPGHLVGAPQPHLTLIAGGRALRAAFAHPAWRSGR